MAELTTNCQFCGCAVKPKKLGLHIQQKCPQSPEAITYRATQPKALHPPKVAKPAAVTKKRTAGPKVVQIRTRLERLFRELEHNANEPDDKDLANEFKAFYRMYVWQGDTRRSGARQSTALNSDGSRSLSIKAVSGGLPSLGKHAK